MLLIIYAKPFRPSRFNRFSPRCRPRRPPPAIPVEAYRLAHSSRVRAYFPQNRILNSTKKGSEISTLRIESEQSKSSSKVNEETMPWCYAVGLSVKKSRFSLFAQTLHNRLELALFRTYLKLRSLSVQWNQKQSRHVCVFAIRAPFESMISSKSF